MSLLTIFAPRSPSRLPTVQDQAAARQVLRRGRRGYTRGRAQMRDRLAAGAAQFASLPVASCVPCAISRNGKPAFEIDSAVSSIICPKIPGSVGVVDSADRPRRRSPCGEHGLQPIGGENHGEVELQTTAFPSRIPAHERGSAYLPTPLSTCSRLSVPKSHRDR
jgi:hypothetical protein